MKVKYIIYAFLLSSLLISCGSTKTVVNSDDKFVGNWSIVAEKTPQGDVPITMAINKNEAGIFEGTFKSVMGNFIMNNLVLKNGIMSCDFNVQGMIFEFEGVFTKNDFKGKTLAPGQTYITNGKRMKK